VTGDADAVDAVDAAAMTWPVDTPTVRSRTTSTGADLSMRAAKDDTGRTGVGTCVDESATLPPKRGTPWRAAAMPSSLSSPERSSDTTAGDAAMPPPPSFDDAAAAADTDDDVDTTGRVDTAGGGGGGDDDVRPTVTPRAASATEDVRGDAAGGEGVARCPSMK
jgi:hypothetical protein